ncbi:SDR family NAD(P)-dependent oxidoreductase [Mycolicibacterium vaccae]|uniref:SDR family NAD(P)-dependent oxidoreductase n=1 Tax=Mycolicibacterium vaccae TaxID=1810 RepID=UPI003CF64B92
MGALEGNVAVITGATSGIGSKIANKIAKRYAAEDASLILTGRDGGRADSLVAELRQSGTTVEFVLGELREDGFVDELTAAVADRHGRIDTLHPRQRAVPRHGRGRRHVAERLRREYRSGSRGPRGGILDTRGAGLAPATRSLSPRS